MCLKKKSVWLIDLNIFKIIFLALTLIDAFVTLRFMARDSSRMRNMLFRIIQYILICIFLLISLVSFLIYIFLAANSELLQTKHISVWKAKENCRWVRKTDPNKPPSRDFICLLNSSSSNPSEIFSLVRSKPWEKDFFSSLERREALGTTISLTGWSQLGRWKTFSNMETCFSDIRAEAGITLTDECGNLFPDENHNVERNIELNRVHVTD